MSDLSAFVDAFDDEGRPVPVKADVDPAITAAAEAMTALIKQFPVDHYVGWPDQRHYMGPTMEEAAEVGLAAARPLIERRAKAEALRPFEDLFSGGPDTACRTTWPDGVECVEVPVADLAAAFEAARADGIEREGLTP